MPAASPLMANRELLPSLQHADVEALVSPQFVNVEEKRLLLEGYRSSNNSREAAAAAASTAKQQQHQQQSIA
ncbi:hypothetical protein Emag_001466 [Eimeria magna]